MDLSSPPSQHLHTHIHISNTGIASSPQPSERQECDLTVYVRQTWIVFEMFYSSDVFGSCLPRPLICWETTRAVIVAFAYSYRCHFCFRTRKTMFKITANIFAQTFAQPSPTILMHLKDRLLETISSHLTSISTILPFTLLWIKAGRKCTERHGVCVRMSHQYGEYWCPAVCLLFCYPQCGFLHFAHLRWPIINQPRRVNKSHMESHVAG